MVCMDTELSISHKKYQIHIKNPKHPLSSVGNNIQNYCVSHKVFQNLNIFEKKVPKYPGLGKYWFQVEVQLGRRLL